MVWRMRWQTVVGCAALSLFTAVHAPAARAERVWLAPVKLPGAAGGAFAQVAVNARGDAAAVWQGRRGGGGTSSTYVQGAVRRSGGLWRSAVRLSPEGVSASSPRVGLGDAGEPVAVWRGLDDASTSVHGGAFGSPSLGHPSIGLLASDADVRNPFARAQIAVDARGGALAVWDRDHIGGVRSSFRPQGGRWQPAIELAAHGGAAQIAVNPRGDAIAAWQGFSGVQVATRPAGGDWQAAIGVSAAGDYALEPQVAIDRHNNAVVAWTSLFEERPKVRAATMTATGGWQSPTELTAGRAGGTPHVAMDGEGNAFAVWKSLDGSSVVRSSVRPAGTATWQTPVRLSAPGADASAPQVAVDAKGAAIAIWDRDNNSITRVQAARRPAGGTWQAPVNLSGRTPAFSARVALDARGRALALWGTSGGIVSAEYTTGPAIRALRIVPTTLGPSRRARVRYALNTSARVRFTLERAAPGRRDGSRCVKQNRDNRYANQRCIRWLAVPGGFTRTRRAGTDRFVLTARGPTGIDLRPGQYKLAASPVSGRQAGRQARVSFRIAR